MSRILSSIIGVVMMCSSLWAQISFSSDTFYASGQTTDDIEIVAEGSIRNNTNSQVLINWLRTDVDIPSSWPSTVICGSLECFKEFVDTSPYPDTIAPFGESNLDVHFNHNHNAGEGTVLMKAWVIGDSANTEVMGVFKASVSPEVGGINKSYQNDKIRIYPNPAKDYILIKNLPENEILTVEVYNIFGRRMLSFSQAPTNTDTIQKLDINTLAKGIYMIRVFDSGMNVIYTESLSKE